MVKYLSICYVKLFKKEYFFQITVREIMNVFIQFLILNVVIKL